MKYYVPEFLDEIETLTYVHQISERLYKRGTFHDSWAAARSFLITRLEVKLIAGEASIAEIKQSLIAVEALTEPEMEAES